VQFFEHPNNALLDVTISEGFLQAHVYCVLVDSLFFDMSEVKVIRGEQGSRAVSFRKNAKRQYGEKKKSSAKLDAIVRMRDVWGVELVAMESGRNDMLEGQTKMLSDRYKLARELKDQIDYLYASLPANHKSKIVNLEVFGILTSGLEGRVYVMNLPCSGTYKFVKLFQFELPRTVDQLGHLTKTVVRFLHLKQRVRNVVGLLNEVPRDAPLEILGLGMDVWSPASRIDTPFIRETPTSPTRSPSLVKVGRGGTQRKTKKE